MIQEISHTYLGCQAFWLSDKGRVHWMSVCSWTRSEKCLLTLPNCSCGLPIILCIIHGRCNHLPGASKNSSTFNWIPVSNMELAGIIIDNIVAINNMLNVNCCQTFKQTNRYRGIMWPITWGCKYRIIQQNNTKRFIISQPEVATTFNCIVWKEAIKANNR